MPESGKAIATHLILARPPMLSRGRIMPNAIQDFENHAENYYSNAKHGIPDNEKVTKILGCFENPLINDWISVNHSHLCTLSFEDFMAEFRTRWLPKNWVEDVCNEILGSRQDLKVTTFESWSAKIQTLNVALRGTDSHLDDNQMC